MMFASSPGGVNGGCFVQDMYVVRFTVQFQKREAFLIQYGFDCVINHVLHISLKYGMSVLCYQHHMILQKEAAVPVLIVRSTFGFPEHMYDISLTPIVLYSIIIL